MFFIQNMFRVKHHSSSVDVTFLIVTEFQRIFERFTKFIKITIGLCQQYAFHSKECTETQPLDKFELIALYLPVDNGVYVSNV